MILIADDHVDSAEYLARLLRKAGYKAFVYPSAGELLDQVGKVTPRLIILDVHMPRMTGIECLRAVRRTAEWAGVPVIMYSADFNYECVQEAGRAGAQEYLVKGTILWPHFRTTVEKYAGPAELPAA